MQKFLCLFFKIIYYRWTKDCKVIKVKGWRTAIIDSPKESRRTITPCFKILFWNFE
jgi:hypothetical protein